MQRKELFSRIFDAGPDPEKYMSNDIRLFASYICLIIVLNLKSYEEMKIVTS